MFFVPRFLSVPAVLCVALMGAGCQTVGGVDFPTLRPIDRTAHDKMRLESIQQKRNLATAHSVQGAGDSSGNTDSQLNTMRATAENRLATLYFDTGQSGLSAWDKQLLSRIADWMQKNDRHVLLVGHSSFYLEHNSYDVDRAIGFKRAQATYDYLVGRGVPSGRLNVVNNRHASPRYSPITTAGQVSNQRVEIVLIK